MYSSGRRACHIDVTDYKACYSYVLDISTLTFLFLHCPQPFRDLVCGLRDARAVLIAGISDV